MDYRETEKHNKAQKANNDFNFLMQSGNIAFYKSVELTQVFIFDKKNKVTKNFFTLFTFSEEDYTQTKEEYLTDKPIQLNKNYSFGIVQFNLTINDTKKIFRDIQNNKLILNNEKCLISENLFLNPRSFIQKENLKKTHQLNSILKPNYWGDNYIIEFFDETKSFFDASVDSNTSRLYIERICKTLIEVNKISMDLQKNYDRLGNIIFQFPITLIKTKIESCQDFINVIINCESHPMLTTPRELFITVQSSFDSVITGEFVFETNQLSFSKKCELGDDNDLEISIIDKKNNILLHSCLLVLTKYITCSMNIGLQNAEPRIIRERDLSIKYETDLVHREVFGVGVKPENGYEEYIRNRQKNDEIIQHSNDYCVLQGNQRDKALAFLHSKIQQSGIKEICLWDPYLNAIDIMDVLYVEQTGLPFKCVTSYQKSKTVKDGEIVEDKDKISSFEQFKKSIISDFENLSNNLNINLKFLAQHGNYGWEFHDRFLIIVPIEDTQLPDVYSLGTSVNILGRTHHIIQKVTNPNIIYHNFQMLWNSLDNNDCILVNYENGVRR